MRIEIPQNSMVATIPQITQKIINATLGKARVYQHFVLVCRKSQKGAMVTVDA